MAERPVFVAVNGSPRKEGNAAALLDVIAEAIREEGGEVRVIHLIDYPIRPCLGHYSEDPPSCNPRTCTEGELDDGMKGIFDLLMFADGLLIVTPVYWFQPSGLVKTFIDRLTALENAGRLLEGKVGGIAAVCEEEGAASAIMALMATLNDMGLLIPPYTLVWHHGHTPVRQDPDTVRYARRLGKNMVQLHRLAGNRFWSPGFDDLKPQN